MPTLFVDEINISSLAYLVFRARAFGAVWHFEPISPAVQRWLGWLRRFGLIRATVRQIEHHIGQVTNEQGESHHLKLDSLGRSLCLRIREEQIATNPLVREMASLWPLSKILRHFDKVVEREVCTECLRIGLAQWLLRTQFDAAVSRSALLIERKQWFPYLKAHSRSEGLRLLGYRHPWTGGKLFRGFSRLSRALVKEKTAFPLGLLRRWRRVLAALRPASPGKSSDRPQSTGSPIAIRYWYRKLSFDSTERSEFFWLDGAGIPYSDILLYDYVSDKPVDAATLQQLKGHGITVVGRAPGIPRWVPTRRMYTLLLPLMLKLGAGAVKSLARGRLPSLYFIRGLLSLSWDFAYWSDFYQAHGVRVNVGVIHTKVGQVLAMDSLNGVSAGYQYAISNNVIPTTAVSSGEDVQFVFSADSERLWQAIHTTVDTIVHTGFIYDGAFEKIRGSGRSAELRKQLQAAGARYIVCFFDENFASSWNIDVKNGDLIRDYEFLLNWLLSDQTVGMVFKPKRYSKDMFQRISPLADLIMQAEETNRCRFLTSDTVVGSTYPAEAALAADICVSILIGGTAGLEARLVGVPCIFMDELNVISHPFYKWGRGRILFDSWESLRSAVERYRVAPEECSELGDWSPGLDSLDPFRDGQAGLRMGLYIRWLHDALKEGASKEAAIAQASKKFANRWGEEHVVVAGREQEPAHAAV